MTRFHNLLKSFLCLGLLGILSGCVLAEVAMVGASYAVFLPSPDPDPEFPWRGTNHYEPIILTSNKDMMRIKYLSVGPNAEHERVKQLMFDNCHGAFIEISRVELRGYDTVEAECTHNTDFSFTR